MYRVGSGTYHFGPHINIVLSKNVPERIYRFYYFKLLYQFLQQMFIDHMLCAVIVLGPIKDSSEQTIHLCSHEDHI